MKFNTLHFLFTLVVMVSASIMVVSASDPNALQDFCVAINDTKTSVFVNGKFCKDPKLTTADDFSFSGFHIPRSTANQIGSNVTLLNVDKLPGVNTLGIAMARIDYAANGGMNPPHIHPRASELLTLIEGTLLVGFVSSNQDNNRLFSKVLYAGDAFVFPKGLIHFQVNIGKINAVAISSLSGQNPGIITIANTVFGSNPSISPDVLAKAFQLNPNVVKKLQTLF